jgi:hypothetical protein
LSGVQLFSKKPSIACKNTSPIQKEFKKIEKNIGIPMSKHLFNPRTNQANPSETLKLENFGQILTSRHAANTRIFCTGLKKQGFSRKIMISSMPSGKPHVSKR